MRRADRDAPAPGDAPGKADALGALDRADLELVRGLVEIPSVSRDEGRAVEWLVARMRERGFRAYADEAGNAVGEIGDGPVHVVLLGHIDTVPGEIPVRIEGGALVGRGAVDAKGPLAAFVSAATAPVEGLRVTVVGAVEEESPTSAGARYRARLPAPDHCVIGEPSGWDAVTVAYKGRLVVDVALERTARHGAAPGPTITEEALVAWERLQTAARAHGGARAFDRLDCRLEGIWTGDRDGLAERASLRVGYRIPAGLSIDEVESETRSVLAAGSPGRPGPVRPADASEVGPHHADARATVARIGAEEPVRTERTSKLARAFARSIAALGGSPRTLAKSGTSDMNVLAPAWRCPMVAYGPGDSAYDHTPMERLSLEEHARAIGVLRGVLARLATDP